MSTLKLFYASGTCSLASHIALEESGLPFEGVRIDFGTAQQTSQDYLAINAKGRVPALTVGGSVVTESPAVLRVIARMAPAAELWPDDPLEDGRCLEWLAWCCSTVHVAYTHVARPERYALAAEAKEDVIRQARRTARTVWEQVEAKLAATSSEWSAGQRFSVADAYLFVFWTWGSRLGYDMERDFQVWTHLARRVISRPAVRRVLDREGIEVRGVLRERPTNDLCSRPGSD